MSFARIKKRREREWLTLSRLESKTLPMSNATCVSRKRKTANAKSKSKSAVPASKQ